MLGLWGMCLERGPFVSNVELLDDGKGTKVRDDWNGIVSNVTTKTIEGKDDRLRRTPSEARATVPWQHG